MQQSDIDQLSRRIRTASAVLRISAAAVRMRLAAKYNPNWHLQPRVPAGNPEGGRWTTGAAIRAAIESVQEPLRRLTIALLREAGRRIGPELRRMPQRWKTLDPLPTHLDFPELQGRLGEPTTRRPGHKSMRFRTERELRAYLGPAGPGREWHHIVEKRLAGILFPAELIHSTDNIINLPVELHRNINGRMSRKARETKDIVRRFYISRFSFRDQYNYGIDLIIDSAEEFGYDPDRL